MLSLEILREEHPAPKLNHPDYILYYRDGRKCYEEYTIYGRYHREDGPAKEGLSVCEFWLNNKKCPFQKWLSIVSNKISSEKYDELLEKYG